SRPPPTFSLFPYTTLFRSLLMSRCAVHTETPFTWAHCATVITRASSSARASSSGSDWWWRVTYTSSLGGVLTSSCSIVVRTPLLFWRGTFEPDFVGDTLFAQWNSQSPKCF